MIPIRSHSGGHRLTSCSACFFLPDCCHEICLLRKCCVAAPVPWAISWIPERPFPTVQVTGCYTAVNNPWMDDTQECERNNWNTFLFSIQPESLKHIVDNPVLLPRINRIAWNSIRSILVYFPENDGLRILHTETVTGYDDAENNSPEVREYGSTCALRGLHWKSWMC